MLELLASLRANGFKTYAVSGDGIELMRHLGHGLEVVGQMAEGTKAPTSHVWSA